jgi:hypothetical protein
LGDEHFTPHNAPTLSFRLLVLALPARDPSQVSLMITAKEISNRVQLSEQRFHVAKQESKCCSEHHQYGEAKSELIHAWLKKKQTLER